MISFIVPAYNEARLIGETLDAIHAAAKPLLSNYEIVVADDASTDNTPQVAERHGARVIATENRQIAATRNAGALEASGDVLVFVDADTLINRPLLAGMLDAFSQGTIAGGAQVHFERPLPWYGYPMEQLWRMISRTFKLAAGSFIFCQRSAFEAVGGFDDTLYCGEEIDLSRKLKKQGAFVILREPVVTSPRKFESHSLWDFFLVILRLALSGGRARSRRGLGLWYDRD